MVFKKRSECRLCNSTRLLPALELNPIPLSENYSKSHDKAVSQTRYPLQVRQCATCWHVQLVDIVDTKLLWNSYSYFTNKSAGMLEHFKEISLKLETFIPENSFNDCFVVDIGSNDGTFLKVVKELGAQVLGVDPAREVANYALTQGVPTIVSVLNLETVELILSKYGQADVVTAFNVFAHTDDLREFTTLIGKLLKPGGILVFEAQYLRDIIERNLIATFFHEHMSHHSLVSLVPFLESLDFYIFHADRLEIQHGSIVGYCTFKYPRRELDSGLGGLIMKEQELGLDSTRGVEILRRRFMLNKIAVKSYLTSKKKDAVIFGYGASRSGPTLIIQFELEDFIEFVVDDDENKLGKFETGAGYEIRATSYLLENPRSIAVILAWVQAPKIIAKHSSFTNSGGEFLILSPNPHIVSSKGIRYLI